MDWSYYDPLLQKLAAAKFQTIILLDAGGRFDFDDDGHAKPPNTVFPAWFRDNLDFFAKNFQGESVSQVCFANTAAVEKIARFYQSACDYLRSNYGDAIESIALGIQQEFEVKYNQQGYVWCDYNDLSQIEFKREYNSEMPIIDFGRSVLTAGNAIPLFRELLQYRSKTILKCVSLLSKIIRSSGFRVMAYFGEVFTSHDAIFGSAIISQLATQIDDLAVDYNFYDGWERQANPWKVPLMANYAKALGYKRVFAGFYVERWREPVGEPGSKVSPLIFPLVAESIFICRSQNLISGIEIGGFGDVFEDLGILNSPLLRTAIRNDLAAILSQTKQANVAHVKTSIALFASHATFDLFIGEHAFNRNLHADALTSSYALLCSSPQLAVTVISDKMLQRQPEILRRFDLVYVAHQPALNDISRAAFVDFVSYGKGVLVQDVRCGEWTEQGAYTGDWMNSLFGIAGIEWRSGGHFLLEGRNVEMPKPTNVYASHAILSAASGFEILLPCPDQGDTGLMLRGPNTLVLGYVPGLVEGTDASKWRRFFIDYLVELMSHHGDRIPARDDEVVQL